MLDNLKITSLELKSFLWCQKYDNKQNSSGEKENGAMAVKHSMCLRDTSSFDRIPLA